MCLTQPAMVLELRPDELVVDVDGRCRVVSRLLVPEARVGDEVLVGMGQALRLLEYEEAAGIRDLLAPIVQTPDRA
jgi:hydrogenase expression/formation protein HypC